MANRSQLKSKLKTEDFITVESRDFDPSGTKGENIPLQLLVASSSGTNGIIHPLPVTRPHQQQPANERWTESPQREIVEITSSLTINNLSKYTALARAKRKLLFVARKTDQNHLALHSLRGDGKSTPDVIMLKDNQVRALTPNEAHRLLDRKS